MTRRCVLGHHSLAVDWFRSFWHSVRRPRLTARRPPARRVRLHPCGSRWTLPSGWRSGTTIKSAAQRLNVEASKADEITAALKPNPSLSFTGAVLSDLFAEPADLGQFLQQSGLYDFAQLSVRARRQAGQTDARRPGHHGRHGPDHRGQRAAARLSDPAAVHRRAAGASRRSIWLARIFRISRTSSRSTVSA